MATQKIVRTYSSGIELRLKVLRVLLEIKRETMAEILGINLNTYSAYENENNVRKVSDDLLENILTKVKEAAVTKDKIKVIIINKAVAETLDKEWLFFGNRNIVTDSSNILALGFSKAYRIVMIMRELGISVAEMTSDLYLTENSLNDLFIDEFGLIKSFKINHKAEAEDIMNKKIKVKGQRKQREVIKTNMISWSNKFLLDAFINYLGLNAHWFETGEGDRYRETAITRILSNEDSLQKALLDRLLRYVTSMSINFTLDESYSLNMLFKISRLTFINLEWLLTGKDKFSITSEDLDNLYYNPEAPLALPECDMPSSPDLWVAINSRWYNVSKKDIVLPVLPPDYIGKNSPKQEKIGILNLRKRIISYLEMCSYPKDRIAEKLEIAKSKIELWQKVEIMPPLALLIKLSKDDCLNLHWLITGHASPDYRYNIYEFFRTVDNPPVLN